MTIVGVTGAAGMMGWHARCILKARGIESRTANRETFASPSTLDTFVQDCDAILHFAGMNRGSEDEIHIANVALASELVAACDRVGVTPQIVFANSTHEGRSDAYGQSKAAAAAILATWGEQRGALVTDLVMPHVFGERGRPFYNSVVHTFCHQLMNGEAPRIERDGELELVHAQDAIAAALTAVSSQSTGKRRVRGTPLKVSELLATLDELHGTYTPTRFPDLSDPLRLRLFNVLRSYGFPDQYPTTIPEYSDTRGSFFEIAKSTSEGQCSFSTTVPGIIRGDHFHLQKVERFLVVQGRAAIRLRRLFDNRVVEFAVSGDEPVAIDMPTMHTHSITNVGDDKLLTLFWINEIFDPASPDTFAEPVVLDSA